MQPGVARRDPIANWLLIAFYAFVVAAVSGFATFGLHPELLARTPGAASAYGIIYRYVGSLQVWLAFAVLAIPLVRVARTRWLLAFAAAYLVGFASEFVGTGYGIPFGGYGYTALLGPKILERVPVVIPLSWFAMGAATFALAGCITRRPVARIGLGTAFMVTWDLALDPAMSFLTPYWVWADTGPYYGMPWLNLAGWAFTAALIMTVLSGLKAADWLDQLSPRWVAGYYGANLLMPLGMLAAAGLWVGVIVTLGALAFVLALSLGPARAASRVALEEVRA